MKLSIGILTFTLLFAAVLSGQPTITQSWIGGFGDRVGYIEATSIPSPGDAGEDMIWDFSEIDGFDTTLVVQSYVNADTTEFAGDYPDANTCLYVGLNLPEVGPARSYSYGRATENGWEQLGSVTTTDFATIRIESEDPRTLIPFPFTYQSTGSDSYSIVTDLGVAQTFLEGQLDLTGDAYGTVILPNGTFGNALRVRSDVTRRDSTDLGFNLIEITEATDVTYQWFSLDHPAPLATYTETESFSIAILEPLPPDTSDVSFDTTFAYDPVAVSSGVRFFDFNAFDMSVSPNPVKDEINVSYTLEQSAEIDIEVRALTGQIVRRIERDAATGQNLETIDVATLPPGGYLVLLIGEDTAGVQKVVKL